MNNIIEKLAGTWYIICSDFPLWLKGDKRSPSFNYSVKEKKGIKLLQDEVSYYKNGKLKFIRGYDLPDHSNENSFTWRGKGLLFFVRSKWKVHMLNENEGWAVISFSGTIFTPEGVDIVSRNKTVGPILLDQIKAQMMHDEILRSHVRNLVLLR